VQGAGCEMSGLPVIRTENGEAPSLRDSTHAGTASQRSSAGLLRGAPPARACFLLSLPNGFALAEWPRYFRIAGHSAVIAF